jgi:hypothetical protein
MDILSLLFTVKVNIFQIEIDAAALRYHGDEGFQRPSSDARNAEALAISSGTSSRPSEFQCG